MTLLLGLDLPPVSHELGFLRSSLPKILTCFMEWQRSILQPRGIDLRHYEPRKRDLRRIVCDHLAPLVVGERTRYLFLPTADGCTFFFDNGAHGTDASSLCSVLARLGPCEAARIVLAPSRRESYGATILETYMPDEDGSPRRGRTISAANDGGRWVFEQYGPPLPFENLEAYSASRARDRFTPELLREYVAALNIPAFDPQELLVYDASVVAKIGPLFSPESEVPLAGCLPSSDTVPDA